MTTTLSIHNRNRAQISRAAIERLYVAMRHLFIRGHYKPLGASGEAMIEALRSLQPEIYGSINDSERVELDGLLYIFQRLPRGIEECRFVKLISREGFEDADFEPLMPPKRRRNCYRIDHEQMYIEMTRGRSDIYDILTHLTFMYVEAEKIRLNALDSKSRKRREWQMLKQIVEKEQRGEEFDKEVAYTYLSSLLGRTYADTRAACEKFAKASGVNSIFNITYSLGKLSMDEEFDKEDREISFSSALREKIGHHIYGEVWAQRIKGFIVEKGWAKRPIHIISANLHSVMNSIYAPIALRKKLKIKDLQDIATELSLAGNDELRDTVEEYASKNGMHFISDQSGTNISVQIFDLQQIDPSALPTDLQWQAAAKDSILIVLNYAFGEQAYEIMDELLKPYEDKNGKTKLHIQSINIMGKAGILEGIKGDIMIPNAHIFEGTADNYPFENALTEADFADSELGVYSGPMISVLGTSLQNRDILRYFLKSSWNAIGLEMEGAHYQKAIQAASKIRNSIDKNVTLRYAYYASDNPLETGGTLASGPLGTDGVKPTYLITVKMLNGIFEGN
ncbi:MAG: hypothetical protein AB8G22_21035 [Saprospiraceae bacterium]